MSHQFACSIQDASNQNRFSHFVIIETRKHSTVCFQKTQSGLSRITHICQDCDKTWPKNNSGWESDTCSVTTLSWFSFWITCVWRRLDKAFFGSNYSFITLHISHINRVIRSCAIPLTTKVNLTELTDWFVAAPWVLLVEQPQSAVTLLQTVLQRCNVLSLSSSCLHDSLLAVSVWHSFRGKKHFLTCSSGGPPSSLISSR